MADAPKPSDKSEIVKVTVAHGRTVHHDGESYGPGKEVELSKKVAADLMKLGFLSDPDAPSPPLPQGARVGLVASERR
jgi:hypothetical protein